MDFLSCLARCIYDLILTILYHSDDIIVGFISAFLWDIAKKPLYRLFGKKNGSSNK